MRLLKVDSFFSKQRRLELQYFVDPPGRYAILSHTWGEDEVLFEDISRGTASKRGAYDKLLSAAKRALRDEFSYLWVDTCCIDKSSSAELQEAINSMYRYYRKSSKCYIYLQDVTCSFPRNSPEFEEEFTASRWFTRGWTLQELIAPRRLTFFTRDWKKITDTMGWDRLMDRQQAVSQGWKRPEEMRDTHLDILDRVLSLVETASGVPKQYLNATYRKSPSDACVALKMSWASHRRTTRKEDAAYSLLGLFDVSMPLLYGEGGEKAFIRLQEEIMKQSDDHTLFAWVKAPGDDPSCSDDPIAPHGLLADSPYDFSDMGMAEALEEGWIQMAGRRSWSDTDPYHLTSRGLQIRLPLQHIGGNLYRAILDCTMANADSQVAVYLVREAMDRPLFQRVLTGFLDLVSSPDTATQIAVLVRQRRPEYPSLPSDLLSSSKQYSIQASELTANTFVVSVATREHPEYWKSSRCDYSVRRETWETFGRELFETNYHTTRRPDVTLLIEHTRSQQRLIVHFNLLGNFFVGFHAYEASLDKDTIRSGLSSGCISLHNPDQTRFIPAGQTMVVQTCNLAYHIKVEVLQNGTITDVGKQAEDYVDDRNHFRLQLSVETSRLKPVRAIDGGDDWLTELRGHQKLRVLSHHFMNMS